MPVRTCTNCKETYDTKYFIRWIKGYRVEKGECKICHTRKTSYKYGCIGYKFILWKRKIFSLNGMCAYCREIEFHQIDHFYPRNSDITVFPGGNSIDNLVPACVFCNSRKRNRDPYEFQITEFGEIRYTLAPDGWT